MNIKAIAASLLLTSAFLALPQASMAGKPDQNGKPDDKPPPAATCDLTTPATHSPDCRIELSGVVYAIDSADLKDKDRSRLQSKVCAADAKLEVTPFAKTGDAYQKLQDIIETVYSKRKIGRTDAANIAGEAMLAQSCVGLL